MDSGRILDIGCGGGHFLLHMKDWKKYGIEISTKARAAATSQNVTAFADLHQSRFPDSFFDVITMFAVIEHMADPRSTMLEVARIMKPGGLLVIMTGDVSSIKAQIKGNHWHMYRPPEHLFFFNGRSLDRLAHACGFTRVHRYYTDGGMTTHANRYIKKMLVICARIMDRLPLLPCLPLFDHNYSYYRKFL
jgi:SAM-dependent methyltransferase